MLIVGWMFTLLLFGFGFVDCSCLFAVFGLCVCCCLLCWLLVDVVFVCVCCFCFVCLLVISCFVRVVCCWLLFRVSG